MQKLMKVFSAIFIAASIGIYACRVAAYFLPANSDISIFGKTFASEGLLAFFAGSILIYQLKVIDLSKQLKAKSK